MTFHYLDAEGTQHEIAADAFHYLAGHYCLIPQDDDWVINPEHLWTYDQVQCLLTERVPE